MLNGKIKLVVDGGGGIVDNIFQDDIWNNLIKILLFISSGFLAIIAIITLVQDKAIMYLPVLPGGRNLFFFFAIFSISFGLLIKLVDNNNNMYNNCNNQLLDNRISTAINLIGDTHCVGSSSVVVKMVNDGVHHNITTIEKCITIIR